MTDDRSAFTEALAEKLHAERTESGTLDVDCWACEAAKSKAIARIVNDLRNAQGAAHHANAALERAIPDEDARMELWRGYWRDQIAARKAVKA